MTQKVELRCENCFWFEPSEPNRGLCHVEPPQTHVIPVQQRSIEAGGAAIVPQALSVLPTVSCGSRCWRFAPHPSLMSPAQVTN